MPMRFLFWKALAGLVAFDLVLRFRDFATLYRVVEGWRVHSGKFFPNGANEICRAINLACIWYPKRALCLQRAAVTTCMLRSHGVAANLVLGAQKLPFRAHAWVEIGGHPINERAVVETFSTWARC